LSQREKTFVFWIGLIILGLASVALFGIFWFDVVIRVQIIPLDYQVPFIVATIAFIMIGLYMMRSGVRVIKEKASTAQW
jgi:biotin transporter BioY